MGWENQRTILLIEEDDQTRPILKHNLVREGFRVIVALDEEDALSRVDGGHPHADLILLNLVKKSPEEVLSIGRRVREGVKYNSRTPLVVMPEKYGGDVEGTDVNVGGNDWITYLEDGDQLNNLLRRLLQPVTE
jgi:DNA-binding response OmpR family regulator